MKLSFRNACVFGRQRDIHIAQGCVMEMGDGPSLDLSEFLTLPGIIDLHGDAFERHLAPRRGAQQDMALGLRATDQELAANGITTACLAQFYSWEGGYRGPDFCKAFLGALSRVELATDHIVQLRFETHLLDDYETVLSLVDRHKIPYVAFNDHLPHKHLEAGKKPPRLTGQALKSGRNPDAHHQMLKDLHANGPDVRRALPGLAKALQDRGVKIASHDDPDPETRATFAAMGAGISEFPMSFDVATNPAHPSIMGAPNVVRGGSHDGRLAAIEVIQAGGCDALVSDYHYPSLRMAAQKLVRGGTPIEQAWAYISAKPAAIMGWADRGHLDPGARADLVVLDPDTWAVEATLCRGRFSYVGPRIAERLVRLA